MGGRDGQAGCDARGPRRRRLGGRLLAQRQARPHRFRGQDGMAVGGGDGHACSDARGARRLCHCVAFSGDGRRVLTGSQDGAARLWDAATGAAVTTLEGTLGLPHRRRLFARRPPRPYRLPRPDGKAVARFSSAQAEIDEIKASLPRCLTSEERRRFHLREVSRWCYARNLWPHLDHGPPETAGSSPPYGPPAMTWDEQATLVSDAGQAWLARSEPAINTSIGGFPVKSP